MKDSLVKDSDDYKRWLEDAALTPDHGKWYWVIRYEARVRRGGSTGQPPYLRLVVLMDGTVIKPVVRDYR